MNDSETGLYYFGARYLDPKTSRWISSDPAMGDYLPSAPVSDEARKRNGNLPGMGGVFNLVNLHVYHYAGNNPVKYVDPDGRAAGDEFDTMDETAIDFANTYNDDTIRHNREYGSTIYQKENGKYFYSVPNVGHRQDVKLSTDSNYKDKKVATIHTHPDGIDMYAFSPTDIDLAYDGKTTSYLVTADGVVSKYDPAEDNGSSSDSWKQVEEVIYFDAPDLKNYNKYPDDKINIRSLADFLIDWRPYHPSN